tara:strand:- start:442 stop:579 length:138 start_codon:yes stop_codon:yes gene_type:complete
MDWGIALQPNGLLFGVEYFPLDHEQPYNELNIYLLIIVLHFRVYV